MYFSCRYHHLAAFGLLLLAVPGLAQDYHWPTEASRKITATFGDMRPRRYHAGLDIATRGTSGYEVYAVEDGYVERLLVGTQGYGKAIYLRLKDRRLAVYAHLQKFAPGLERRVRTLQERQGKYALDLRFGRSDIPVRRGDVIAYTGDTGTISGPHLHFELRDAKNRPLNPLANGIEFEDEAGPEIASLAIIPLSPETVAHGSPLPSIIPALRTGSRRYVIADTIAVAGPFGLAVEAYDRLPEVRYRPTLYGLSLTVDGIRRYCIQFDHYGFEEGQLVELERDYAQWRRQRTDFHRLFTAPDNDSLSFVQSRSSTKLKLGPGYHRFHIKVWDQGGNTAVLQGVLAYTPPTRLEASAVWSDNEDGWVITLDSSTPLRQYHIFLFDIRGRQVDQFSHRAKQPAGRQQRFVVPRNTGQRRIVQIVGVDRWGARLEPVHLSLVPDKHLSNQRKFTLQIEHLDSGVIFQVSSDYYLPLPPELLLRTGGGVQRYSTRMVSPVDFVSPTFYLSQLSGLEEVIIRVSLSQFRKDSPREVGPTGDPTYEIRLPITGVVVPPTKRGRLSDVTGDFQLDFRPGTFYDSTFVWLSMSETPPPKGARLVMLPVKVGPFTRPYKGPAGLKMLAPTNRLLPDHAGIFYLDQRTGWEFMTPTGAADPDNLIRTRAYRTLFTSGEVFALLEETEPPVIDLLRPGDGATYRQADLRRIRFNIEDRVAGIKDETAISLTLDDQSRIFEYNTSRKAVTYVLPTLLQRGKHKMAITATDQLGNTAARNVTFFIE
ncbi:MAG: M23 family metallopeptidase [Fidelibacterota bacterium]|nr:MAG: M23 family metallopeptidase [Candidatus Neomarinimicrobiota bacterium]